MEMRRGLKALVPMLLGVLGCMPVQAAQLVPGGYGLVGSDASPSSEPFGIEATTGSFVVDFTPRSSVAFLLGTSDLTPSGAAVWDAGAPGSLASLSRLGLVSSPSSSSGEASWVVGGALRVDDITVSASFARPILLGTPSQLFAAGMTIGRFSATVGYATALDPDSDSLAMLMLRTDLAALPWLSLESEMAIGDGLATGSLAVGRIGVRLNF
jgi:hypothetical protein